MSHNLLRGKKGIIFGALTNESIAWAVAEKAFSEGARFTLTNSPLGLRIGQINELAKLCNAEVITADVSVVEDLENLLNKSMEILGGKIDFILHAIGMSKNVLKKRDYDDLNYKDFIQTIDICALSLHKLLQTTSKLDALNEYASVVTLTYIGSQRIFPDYSDMSQAKAMLESIVRNFGYQYGIKKKVRVNAVSQSPTFTTAVKGVKSFKEFYEFADKMSPLGNATAQECGDYCITLFSDLTRKVTMQTLYHDGGFSSTGMSSNLFMKND